MNGVSVIFCIVWNLAAAGLAGEGEPLARSKKLLELNLRTRVETEEGSGRFHAITQPVRWDPVNTAIVVCDMWDDHYCRAAARRVAQMAPRMNEVISAARKLGVLIIHCPSGCMETYRGTPQRRLAAEAPRMETEPPLKKWCERDPEREPPLPVDVSVPCDDAEPRERRRYGTKQIDTIDIHDGDAITDSAEAYFLMRQRGIRNVIVMGVHTNMCVLGRPFGIRQMVYQGQNVVLMRDMTDSMYSPRMAPFVSHFTGNDLVVEHIERFWSPTIASTDILGGEAFRFPDDRRLHLVIVLAEQEYKTSATLPAFALRHLGMDFRVTMVFASAKDRNQLPGIEVLSDADVALWSIRRRTPPEAQLAVLRKHIAAGKPLVAIRTTSHAFCLRGEKPAQGLEEWPDFDRQVLGCVYRGHHGNALETRVRAAPGAGEHPIMKGVRTDEFPVHGSLYRSAPLSKTARELMIGRAGDIEAHQPVAWTNTSPGGGRVFYTSLGHPEDFTIPDVNRLLRNAVYWAAGVLRETDGPR